MVPKVIHSQQGIFDPPPLDQPDTLPDSLLEAYNLLYRISLRRGKAAGRGRGEAENDRLLRVILEVAGKVRDSALGAEAAELASWIEVRDREEPPQEPLGGAIWLVSQAVKVALQIEAGHDLDHASLLEEFRNYRAGIAVEPLEARVEAGRTLREGKAVEQRAPGPTMQPRTSDKAALRMDG